jgi:hypothetical protein
VDLPRLPQALVMTGGQLSLTIMCVAGCFLVAWLGYLATKHGRPEDK